MKTRLDTNQWTLDCPRFKCVVFTQALPGSHQTNGIHMLIQSTRLAQDNTFWTCPFWLMSSWLSHQSHPEIFLPIKKESTKEIYHQYGLHLQQTAGDTFVLVWVYSHHSAALKPGQNHDYQLHSSPNPIMGNRENATNLTTSKMPIKFTHEVSVLCQVMFDIWIGESIQNILTKLSHWRGQIPSTFEHWGGGKGAKSSFKH